MSHVTTVSGRGIPLIGNDIDTDRIIPARFLRCVTFDGLGAQVFADDRTQLAGQHPFDLPQYQGATVLIVNGNFGCGSSREHAPQALAKWGIRAIIGESFAEIFFGNCVAIGIPCVMADRETVQALQTHVANYPETELVVDLESLRVGGGEIIAAITMADASRKMLTSGTWDACGQLLAGVEAIQTTAAKLPYMAWSGSIA